MTAAVLLALLLQGVAPQRAAQVTARISPEAPAIGEVITVALRVRAPVGSEVRFPALPDSAVRVEALDPRAIRDASTASMLDRTAIYRLIAFDTGRATLRFGDVTIRRDGAERRYPVTLPALRIRSVLPADSTGRVPRPARGLLDADTTPWRWIVALVVVALLGYWSVRRWRAWRAERQAAGPDVAVRARLGFEHARALALLEAGETGRHALAHVAVMRRYLSERFPTALPALTAAELAPVLHAAQFPVLPERAVDLLKRAEALAFARAAATSTEAEAIAAAAMALVEDVETAWQARRERQLRDDAARRKTRQRRP
ncbi:MAG: hypothetical protein WD771_10970 [Gemmatimonadaceae bacterium]